MLEYFGNCQTINWDSLVESVINQEPAYVGPRHRDDDDVPGIAEVANVWNTGGYKLREHGGNAQWDMFFPGQNFDPEIATQFAKYVGLESAETAYVWVSRINPGNVAPWHWDVTDDEVTLDLKDRVRYHCHIQRPEDTIGHTLIVEETCLYMPAQGSVYKWPSRKSWHGGSNCGPNPMYTFNFWV